MKIFLIILVLLITSRVTAQQFENVQIDYEQDWGLSEPSITMNPANPNELVAGANINHYYYSIDGGFNWTKGILHSPVNGVWGDPCLITDTAGMFYYIHLSNPPDGNWIDRIVCQKFDIDNNQWVADTYMGLNGTKAQDKAWAVVDSGTNTIYVTWTQFDEYGTADTTKFSNIHFSKSTDGGLTWTDALGINQYSGDCVDSDNTTEGAVPAVGPNGEIYVAWAVHDSILFDRSLDGGQTWLDDDIFVSSQPGGWDYDIPGINRCNGLPITCCDISNSPYQGTIYVNWSDQRNGTDNTDIWISKSTDGGDTWSEAKRVNDDDSNKQQFFTWMTLDGMNGDIYIVFYDRRNYDDKNTDVYMARSTNGGDTFENILISETPFFPSSSVFFGDYTNITAFDGQVRPIWARADETQMSIWTAIVDISVGMPEPDLKPVSQIINYPNPFRETTWFSFKLLKPSQVSLKVYDLFGRKIVTMIDNRNMEPGKYVESFDAVAYNLKPGVYWFVLETGNTTQKRKMILIE